MSVGAWGTEGMQDLSLLISGFKKWLLMTRGKNNFKLGKIKYFNLAFLMILFIELPQHFVYNISREYILNNFSMLI